MGTDELLDSDDLGMAIAKLISDKSQVPPTPDMVSNMQTFWKDIAKEIIDYARHGQGELNIKGTLINLN